MDANVRRAEQETRKFIDSLTSLMPEEREVAARLGNEIINVLATDYKVAEKIRQGLIHGRVVSAALAIATKYVV